MKSIYSSFNPTPEDLEFTFLSILNGGGPAPSARPYSGASTQDTLSFVARLCTKKTPNGFEQFIEVIGDDSVLKVRSWREWLALVDADIRDAQRRGYELLSFNVLPYIDRSVAIVGAGESYRYREVTAFACLKAKDISLTAEAAE